MAITGVSGHIGFRVLTEALIAGYRVYAVVRKRAQVDKIKAPAPVQPYLTQLHVVVIPDLAAPDAFAAVPDNFGAIIHVATPTFSGFNDVNVKDFESTAWKLTENVLEYAARTPSVKRVVVTSSISATTPFFGSEQDSGKFYTSDSPILVDHLKDQPEVAPEPTAYGLSKIYVAARVREFVNSRRPGFSLVSILPGTTVGPNELATTPGELMVGSNIVALGPLMGIKFAPIPTALSHVGDVSKAHIEALALDSPPPGQTRSILAVFNSKADPTPIEWDDSIRFLREDFPEAAASGNFPFGGTAPAQRLLADSTAEEQLLGRMFKGYREAVHDLVEQYLRLASNASK
ncbi:hypothetical protein F5X68DRAFT_241498 [Plectosphaerella plurivora]|uniref:NAD-dependent epimerase/dehydratase domain-containing protein n=1 Tax=Plectosphaerella plurivora TaxID=936078 RepID=A0A9P8V9H9_9PEZI|nr:hypothetical protein F5X68DRAFT_241498 [Plectosphaerella plurivora]